MPAAPADTADTDLVAAIPLTFDGCGWSRHERNAERAVNAFGEPLSPVAIDVGWTVWHLAYFDRGGDHQHGVVYEVIDHDPETSEAGTHYLAAYDDRRDGHVDLHRLVVPHVAVAEAQPPARRALGQLLKACHERAARARSIDAHVLWVTGVLVPRWQAVMAERGWIR